MSASSQKGFTLIEVIIFLAISALMLAGMLVGVGGSINHQRYEEANASLLDYMQSQYNLNDNVRNNRPDDLRCDSGGVSSAGTAQSRGTSDCTIAGRVIFSDNGRDINSRPVYATEEGDENDIGNEPAFLDSLGLIVAPATSEEDDDSYKTMWQTTLYTDKSAPTVQNDFSILIIRMPIAGVVRTYTSEATFNPVSDLESSFWPGGVVGLDTLNLCIQTSGLTSAPPTGVRVIGGASTSNGVQFIPAGSGVCSD